MYMPGSAVVVHVGCNVVGEGGGGDCCGSAVDITECLLII